MKAAPDSAGWTKVSALGAPLALSAGCLFGALRQPAGYDSSVDTISALAARAAHDRWLMTSALIALGSCHVATALGLRGAAATGRGLLLCGGLATLLVAAFPLPAAGSAPAHFAAALGAFVLLAIWPAFATSASQPAPAVLSARTSALATLFLCALLAGFGLCLMADRYVGLSERVVALAEAVWPAVVAFRVARR